MITINSIKILTILSKKNPIKISLFKKMANNSLRADNSFKKYLSAKVSVKRVPTVVCIWFKFMLMFLITRVRLIKIARFSSVLHELLIILATLFSRC